MNKLTLIISFFIVSVTFSQKTVTGMVIDSETKSPLPFANIISNIKTGSITDADGSFEFDNKEKINSITISYIGYKSQSIDINDSSSNYYKVELQKDIQNLNEIVLNGNENPALLIIKKAIDNRESNDPQKALNTYKFNAYNKLLVTANADSINGSIDSIFKKRRGGLKFKKVDSTNYVLKKQLSRSHIFMIEKVSEFSFTEQKGQREKVLANRIAGFEEPINEIISLQLQSFSFYKAKYTLVGNQYISPIANNALNTYNYRILDTVTNNDRSGYMIYYFPKVNGKSAGIEGVLYIDTETYAIQKAIAQINAVINIKAMQNFKYYSNEKVWFPIEKEIKAEKGQSKAKISLFGANILLKKTKKKKDTLNSGSNKINLEDIVHVVSNEKNFDIELNQPVLIKRRGLNIEVDENVSNRDDKYWNRYRTESITERDIETYRYTDSIVKAENYEKKNIYSKKAFKRIFAY